MDDDLGVTPMTQETAKYPDMAVAREIAAEGLKLISNFIPDANHGAGIVTYITG